MKRQDKPLNVKKKTVSGSIHKLPDEFDVFCIGDFELFDCKYLKIPGNFYVRGNIKANANDIFVCGDCFVDGNVDCLDIQTNGMLFVKHNIFCLDIWVKTGANVSENVCCENIYSGSDFIVAGDVVHCNRINVEGLLDCNSLWTSSCLNNSDDFVCRSYENETVI